LEDKLKTFQQFSTYGLTLTVLFLAYCLLYPFHGWKVPDQSLFDALFFDWRYKIFLFDIIQNIFLYLPFGFFLTGLIHPEIYTKVSTPRVTFKLFLLVTTISFFVSLQFETLQGFNPARVPSILDVLLNVLSALMSLFILRLLGCSIGNLIYPIILEIKKLWENKKIAFIVFTAVWLSFIIFHLYPFIPTLHPNRIKQGVNIFIATKYPWDAFITLNYFIQGIILGATWGLFYGWKINLELLKTTISIGYIILFTKIIIVGRYLSLEALAGFTGGVTCFYLLFLFIRQIRYRALEYFSG
jgi:glycopeptide antibiotics resistance protein